MVAEYARWGQRLDPIPLKSRMGGLDFRKQKPRTMAGLQFVLVICGALFHFLELSPGFGPHVDFHRLFRWSQGLKDM